MLTLLLNNKHRIYPIIVRFAGAGLLFLLIIVVNHLKGVSSFGELVYMQIAIGIVDRPIAINAHVNQ